MNFHQLASATRRRVLRGSCTDRMPSPTAFPVSELLMLLQLPLSLLDWWMVEWQLDLLLLLYQLLVMVVVGVAGSDPTSEVHWRMAALALINLEVAVEAEAEAVLLNPLETKAGAEFFGFSAHK